jgi:hypothetical protein
MNARFLLGATTLAGALLTTFASTEAHAFHRMTADGECPGGVAWAGDHQFSVQALALPDVAVALDLMTAAGDVMERINRVGGQSLDFSVMLHFVLPQVMDVDKLGLAPLGPGVLGRATVWTNTDTCRIVDAEVMLDEARNWHWGQPEEIGRDYYDMTTRVTVGGVVMHQARPVLMHELLHAAGLAHSDDSYAFMNYGDHPYANRPDAARIDPLPDDREGLRRIYPTAGTERDVEVLNTWFDGDDISSTGAAEQKRLCQPSKGEAWSPDPYDTRCGIDAQTGAAGSTQVCPGDMLYVRYAMANDGNVAMNVDEQMWLSRDATLSRGPGGDLRSPTQPGTYLINGQRSVRTARRFAVPNGVAYGQSYHVIMFLDTGAQLGAEDSQQNNWIPLRGSIMVKSRAMCQSAVLGLP